MKRKFVGMIWLGLFLFACEKHMDIHLPYEGDKIVVNTLIQPDSVIYIRVTRSVPTNVYDESGYKDIRKASVTLLEDSLPIAPLQVQEISGLFYFVTTQKAIRGKRYTVEVAAPGLQAITATDTLPLLPEVNNATAQKNSNRVQFTLRDRPGAADYYRIRIMVTHTDETISWLLFRLDPAFNNNLVDFFTSGTYNSLVMSDERFNGKEINFVLQTADLLTDVTRVTVEVSSLTHDTYQYFSTVLAQKENTGIIIGAPVRVFTNVVNGYGIVGGINTKKMSFKLE
ncbi:DUF4249 domain-containing protein [Chitinophaga sp. 30R24]|uniref:DUF4249 domain-containing protein n=1 Tax=Chitinophaga sp. 30R24 TaxID=3248838 RepID=UPI003B9005E2